MLLSLNQMPRRATSCTRYIRQDGGQEANESQQNSNEQDVSAQQQALRPTAQPAERKKRDIRRTFRLRHIQASAGEKARSGDGGVATFVERTAKRQDGGSPEVDADSVPQFDAIPPPSEPLKRPSRRAAVRNVTSKPAAVEYDMERKQMEALASIMHQAALEEVERESRSKRVTIPKMSGHKSRAMHRHRAATNGSSVLGGDMDIDDESDYVYDTYVLAPSSDIGAMPVDAPNQFDNIGYLVITEEDQSLWETYLEDEPSDKEWNSDEEDENAEDFYGADYPEDELGSDDEFDRNAYGFRGRVGSDDEEWDEDTGAYSDVEYERMMQPFGINKMPWQFARYLAGGSERD